MEHNAFARVRDLLRYARSARWVAALCGVATAILYTVLVLLGALFADLIVSRGRIPNFAQLPVAEQRAFLDEWKALPEEDRQRAVQHLGFADADNDPSRVKTYQTLVASESVDMPPVPGQMNPDALKEWGNKRKLTGDLYMAAATEHEFRWRAYVWHYLNQRVSSEAADHWQAKIEPTGFFQPPGLGEDNSRPFGSLSLVVRQRNTPVGRAVATFASVSGWTWKGTDPNRSYATGLFVMALAIIFVRAVLIAIMNEAASRAALEVITRLRRSMKPVRSLRAKWNKFTKHSNTISPINGVTP
jgi:hypothetical protein